REGVRRPAGGGRGERRLRGASRVRHPPHGGAPVHDARHGGEPRALPGRASRPHPQGGPEMIDQDALQAAVFTALDGVPGMPPVYDDVPENAPFPYVVIGDDVSAAFDDDCGSGADSMVTIHVWSTYPGRAEAKQ